MPIQGLVRLRKHQFGRQAAFGTKVAATRAYGFKGVPSTDLAWTDPDIDVGSRDPVAAPYRGAPNYTAPLTEPALRYNNLPLLMSGFFGGGEVPTGAGTAQTWTWTPASTTIDEPDVYSYEFFDDVVSDAFQYGDGILESVEISGPEGLGPLTTSMSWRFGSFGSSGSTDMEDNPTVPTAGLSVATDDAIVYLKDLSLFISSDASDLAANQITNALHSFTMRLSQEVDLKRWANGDQSFDVDAYGPGTRGIEIELTFAKTSDTVGVGSESDAWMSDDAVTRFIELKAISKVLAQTSGSIPYSWDTVAPMRYYTRTEAESGGNTTIVLTGHVFYDPTAGSGDPSGFFTSTVVCTLTEAELGLIGS